MSDPQHLPHNWLKSIRLKYGRPIFDRFTLIYAQLAALPRKTRRRLQVTCGTSLAFLALALALSGPPAVRAANIPVNPGSTGVNDTDGGCSLVEAIITANTGAAASLDCSGGTAGASDITATSDGSNPASLNLILNPTLVDNGGPTLTHALVTGSPAIDKAPAADCAVVPTNGADQRGVTRSQDGNVDSVYACDAGAVEFVPTVCGIQSQAELNSHTFGNVTLELINDGTNLDCVRVELVNGDHPSATPPLQTGRYWVINGLQSDQTTPATADYDVNLTLPFATADTDTRACKFPGGLGGSGWDCDDGTNTTFVANTSVTRSGISSFSDWAVGQNAGPTAVKLTSTRSSGQNQGSFGALLAGILLALGSGWVALRHRLRQ